VAASSYQPVVINGVTYYVNNGVYYIIPVWLSSSGNASWCPGPVIQAAPLTAAVVASPASVDTDDSFTINFLMIRVDMLLSFLKDQGKDHRPQANFIRSSLKYLNLSYVL